MPACACLLSPSGYSSHLHSSIAGLSAMCPGYRVILQSFELAHFVAGLHWGTMQQVVGQNGR